MTDSTANRGDFLSQATEVIVENASNDQFGVSELAGAMNMSRSNLLRKFKKSANVSASQFIRQVRLEIAMEMLRETSFTVSEISFKVGFGSPSYFIKCFREHYGFPPGEVGKREMDNSVPEKPDESSVDPRKFPMRYVFLTFAAVVLVGCLIYFLWPVGSGEQGKNNRPEKSIAVLPFKNESSDSSNLYFVNGLMESTLNNLQKIGDLRVISRSSVEKYRKTSKSIPEIAKELHVSYFVEGSGQKIGNKVLLNIQLIEASGDRNLWAEQYSREVGDIFELQDEVATKIASAIQAIVTPDEREQIVKKPTENLQAYDYYLQALDPFYTRTNKSLKKAILLFEKAVEEDPEFALAYADIAISYYLLEMYQTDKQSTDKINSYADKALLYDPKAAESLIAKAFYYIQTEEYHLAQPYLEKALEYNPNSSLAIQMLADFYFRLVPNTEKYLEYALKGVRLNVEANDSVAQSYTYVQLSNALMSSGFIDEALKYINLSLEYYPENYYAPHLKAFILFAKDGNVARTRKLLLSEWKKDTTRIDILQDVAKTYYMVEDYDSSYYYFKRFVSAREKGGLDVYLQENAIIALVYEKMGRKKEAEKLFHAFTEYCEKDQSIYKSANLAVKYAHEGKNRQAIEQLNRFSTMDNYPYWFLLMENDPLFKPFKDRTDFKQAIQQMKERYWENHRKMRALLEEEELI